MAFGESYQEQRARAERAPVPNQRVTKGANNRQGGAYAYGIPTDIQGRYDNPDSWADYSGDSDADVRLAQRLKNENSMAGHGLDSGVDQGSNNAQLNAAMSRIGLRNALGESIAGNAGMEQDAQGLLRQDADEANKTGTSNTRKNFNRRGLLYSGLREGGENSVKSAVASKLAKDSSDTSREYANSVAKQKEAYAAVGLQNQQRTLELANMAFDTTLKNSIARQQAYQQLGEGVGQAGGLIYGSRAPSTPSAPNFGQRGA